MIYSFEMSDENKIVQNFFISRVQKSWQNNDVWQ